MILKKLRTTNFRSIESSEIEFGPTITVFAGPAGSGKTSHIHATDAVLTGRTPHTDRAGKGIKEQRRRNMAGEFLPKADIELVCQFGTDQFDSTIRRTIGENANTLDVPFGGKNISARQALLTDRLGGVDEVPDVLLDPRLFANRSVEEQKQALLKLLRPPSVEVPDAAKAVGISNLNSVQQVDDQIKSIKEGSIRSLNAVIKNLEETCPAEPSPEEVAAANAAVQEEKSLNARLQDAALSVQNAKFLLDEARRHVAEIEQAREVAGGLAELRQRLGAIEADESRARVLSERMTRIQEGLAACSEIELRIAAAKQAAERLPGLRQAAEDAKAELQRCASHYKNLQADFDANRAREEQSNTTVAHLQRTIESIEEIDGQCPTCARKLSAKAKAEVLGLLKSECEREKEALKQHADHSLVLAEQKDAESKKGAAARKDVDRLTREVFEAETLSADTRLVSMDPANLRMEMEGVQAEMGKLSAVYHPDILPLDATIRLQRDRIFSAISDAERAQTLLTSPAPDVDALETALLEASRKQSDAQASEEGIRAASGVGGATLRRAEECASAIADLTRHRNSRERYSMAVESLVRLKDSILGSESAKKLQADCTAIFQRFFPASRVILDPAGAVVAPIGSSDGTPVAHLSSGQKVIFDIGLRIAAARATGFGVLAIDDANKLAPLARQAALECLQACGCQVIMCTTSDNVGKIAGAAVYRMSNPGVWGPTKVERIS